MTAIIKFSPLCGAHSEDPLCYLLEVDDFSFLLDCGWTDTFDLSLLEPLKRVASQIDAILISHPDGPHLGALPYVIGKLNVNVPVYATQPVHRMGKLFLSDLLKSVQATRDFTLWSADDLDQAFDKFVQLKYCQHFKLTEKGQGITITPYAAGHLIGGTVWQISKETEDIVYAVDYNQRRERHLNGTVLETLNRPSLLIADAITALQSQTSRKDRDAEMIEDIQTALRRGGDVLMPTDTSGRVLELLLMLNRHWAQHKLSGYNLILLNKAAPDVLRYAKSQLEWMSENIISTFQTTRENPFDLKCVRPCTSMEEVLALPAPRVVLASQCSLDEGLAKELFVEWANNPNNLVLFTTQGLPGTKQEQLLRTPPPPVVAFTMSRRVPLRGGELEDYYRQKEEERKKKEKHDRRMSRVAGSGIVAMDIVSSDDEAEEAPTGLYRHDLMASTGGGIMGGGGGFFKQQSHSYPLFPCKEMTINVDDYGEIIRPEHFSFGDFRTEEVMVFEEQLKQRQKWKDRAQTGPSKPMPPASMMPAARAAVAPMEIATPQVEERPVETPMKCISWEQKVNVSCQIKYVHQEGRADGRSVKNILAHVAPRKLILVHGSADATDALRRHCVANNVAKSVNGVLCPRVGETVDLTSETNIYRVKLSDAMTSSLHFHTVEQYEVGYFDGVIAQGKAEAAEVPVLEARVVEGEDMGHAPVFVGDVQLSAFKQLLARNGFKADFSKDGVLVVNNLVGLKKLETGRISIEGLVCDEYFRIRDLLYSQYDIL